MNIPFNKPTISGRELEYIVDAIARGQLSGDGHYTHLCSRWIETRIGIPKALLTHSCTAALEMAALLLDLRPGDEVIMPSFTFVSTANAVVLHGGVPVFVDVDGETLNISPAEILRAITPRTRAIFVVHYAGVICDMDSILELAKEYQLTVVEDAAQAFGSNYRGRPAGTFGSMSAFSFHETKNITSGEGGFIGLNEQKYFERSEVIREKGTNRSRFFRGQVDKYTWTDIGSSYLPGELTSAFLYSQLQAFDVVTQRRQYLWHRYDQELRGPAQRLGVRTPSIPSECEHNGHLYFLIFNSKEQRMHFIEHMRSHGIATPFHYIPLHSSPAGRRLGRQVGDLAVTEAVSERLVRLPLFLMDDATQSRIIDATLRYLANAA